MKFELKTENENNTKLFSNFFKAVSILVLIIFLCDFAIKLGIITRQYQINYFCRLLSVEKSTSNLTAIWQRIIVNVRDETVLKTFEKDFK